MAWIVLDNTGGGTEGLSSDTSLSVNGANPRGYSFSTSYGGEIVGVGLGLKAATAGSYTLVVRLYAVDTDVPNGHAGTALALATLTLSVGTTAAYQYLDQATLGSVGSYTLSDTTRYALMVSTIGSGVQWVLPAAGNGVTPSGLYGYTILNGVTSTNGGTSWTTSAFAPAFRLDLSPTCFLRGTLILTSRGEVPVEKLRAGDLVATKFGGLRPIRWIGTQRFAPRFAGKTGTPIRFAPGSLGDGTPSTALFVSPGHAILVGDVLAHAGALVNGTTITQPAFQGDSIDYFHLDLGPHDCVLANGAWAESYFEDQNRNSFHNAADFHARFPGHEPVRQATCLPIVTAGHPWIEGLRAMLAPAAMRRAA